MTRHSFTLDNITLMTPELKKQLTDFLNAGLTNISFSQYTAEVYDSHVQDFGLYDLLIFMKLQILTWCIEFYDMVLKGRYHSQITYKNCVSLKSCRKGIWKENAHGELDEEMAIVLNKSFKNAPCLLLFSGGGVRGTSSLDSMFSM